MEKFGIETVKAFAGYGMEYADDVRKAKEDGTVNIKDARFFIDNLIKLPKMIKQVSAFVDEILDISDAENQEIRNWFMAEYGVIEDKVDALIKAAIKAGVSLANMVIDSIALGEAIKELKENGGIN